jgi:calcineurin-like phosphoesterase family protein
MQGFPFDYYKELKLNNDTIVMCHYPLLVWNKMHYGSYHLAGHSHGGCNHLNEKVRRLDVGVDNHNYKPISWTYIKNRLDQIPLTRPEGYHE